MRIIYVEMDLLADIKAKLIGSFYKIWASSTCVAVLPLCLCIIFTQFDLHLQQA